MNSLCSFAVAIAAISTISAAAEKSPTHPMPESWSWSCPDDANRGTCPYIMAWCSMNDPVLSDGQLTRADALLLLLRNFGMQTGGLLNAVWYWCIHRPHHYDEWPVKGKDLFLSSGPNNVIITGIRNNTNYVPDWEVWDEMKSLAMKNDSVSGRGYFRYQDLSSTGPLRPLFERVLAAERQNRTHPWYGWSGKDIEDLESNLQRSACYLGHRNESSLSGKCNDRFLWDDEFEGFLMNSQFPAHVQNALLSSDEAKALLTTELGRICSDSSFSAAEELAVSFGGHEGAAYVSDQKETVSTLTGVLSGICNYVLSNNATVGDTLATLALCQEDDLASSLGNGNANSQGFSFGRMNTWILSLLLMATV